ncbi:MAG: NAD(P)H-binding protein [Fimbriimonas sp.]
MVLVTGASGYVGSAILRRLCREGREDVVGCARDSVKAAKVLPPGVRLRIADYDDADGLANAFEGVEQVVFVPGDGFGADMLRHNRNVIDAALACGVDRIVFLSILDVAADSPFYYAPVYRDAEARLRASGMGWTILRCGLYSDFVWSAWLEAAQTTGEIRLPAGSARIAPISRADVARAAAAVVQSGRTEEVFRLTGPTALSFREVAALIDSTYWETDAAEYLLRLWAEMVDPWPHAFSSLLASIAQERFAPVSADFETLTGMAPETLSSFIGRRTP